MLSIEDWKAHLGLLNVTQRMFSIEDGKAHLGLLNVTQRLQAQGIENHILAI